MSIYEYLKETDDSDCEKILMLSYCLLKLKRYDEAERLIEKVVEVDPLYFEAYLLLAEIYKTQDKISEEQEIISTVLRWFDNKGLQNLNDKELDQYKQFKERINN